MEAAVARGLVQQEGPQSLPSCPHRPPAKPRATRPSHCRYWNQRACTHVPVFHVPSCTHFSTCARTRSHTSTRPELARLHAHQPTDSLVDNNRVPPTPPPPPPPHPHTPSPAPRPHTRIHPWVLHPCHVTSVGACSRLARANRTPLLPPRLPRPLHAWHCVQELSAGLVDGSLERRHGPAAAAVPATAPAAKEARGHDRKWRHRCHSPHTIQSTCLSRACACVWGGVTCCLP